MASKTGSLEAAATTDEASLELFFLEVLADEGPVEETCLLSCFEDLSLPDDEELLLLVLAEDADAGLCADLDDEDEELLLLALVEAPFAVLAVLALVEVALAVPAAFWVLRLPSPLLLDVSVPAELPAGASGPLLLRRFLVGCAAVGASSKVAAEASALSSWSSLCFRLPSDAIVTRDRQLLLGQES